MTKRRPPLSIYAALDRIACHLPGGWADMAEITGRRESLVRAWGDPDRREQIPVTDAIALDIAYCAADGHGAPVLEHFTHQLDVAGGCHPAEDDALARHAIEMIRECGEACAAVFTATLPGATPATKANSQREVEEAIASLFRALPMLAGVEAFTKFLDPDGRINSATGPPG